MSSTRAGAATQVAPAHGLVGRRPADAPSPRHRQRLANGGLVAAGGVRVPWACGARWLGGVRVNFENLWCLLPLRRRGPRSSRGTCLRSPVRRRRRRRLRASRHRPLPRRLSRRLPQLRLLCGRRDGRSSSLGHIERGVLCACAHARARRRAGLGREYRDLSTSALPDLNHTNALV